MKKSLISIAVLLVCGELCRGQYSAGRSNVLDASPQLGTGGYNSPVGTYNYGYSSGGLGNLYITGNVTAGRQFRGFVPYRDPTQFQGRLGSSALSSFEGDAPNLNRIERGYQSGQGVPYYFRSSTLLPLSAQVHGLNIPGSSLPRNQVLPQSESYGLRAALPRPAMEGFNLPQNLKPADILIPNILTPEQVQRQMGFPEPMMPSLPEKPVKKEIPKEAVTPEKMVIPEPLITPPEPAKPAEEAPPDFSTWLSMQAEKAEKPQIIVGPQAEFAESAKRLVVEGKFTTTQKVLPPGPGETKSRKLSGEKLPVVSELTGTGQDPFSRSMRSAQHLMIQSRYLDAFQQYTEALSIKPDDPLPLFGQAHALIAAGELRTAARHLEEGMKKFPKFARLQIEGARLFGGRSILDRRKKQLENLVEKNNDRQVQILLGYVELLSGDRRKGLQRMADSGLVPIR